MKTYLFVLSALLAGGNVYAASVVEKFSGKVSLSVDLPGSATGTGFKFSGTHLITSLDFEAGARSYKGKSIDLHGHETGFLPTKFSGSMDVSPSAGSARGNVSITGGVTATAAVAKSSIAVGKEFAADNLDLIVGDSVRTLADLTWNSSEYADLNGESLQVSAVDVITSVDAANGVVDATVTGTITGGGVPPQDTSDADPKKAGIGLGTLIVGLLGSIVTAKRRSRS